MSSRSGIPLLSGPPPPHPGPDQKACRKCGREFGLLFHRQHKCMHCGFGYCSPCTDYQALMPRSGPSRGYDVASVCSYCIELLSITALGRAQLRSLPIAKLRRYITAYNIQVKDPIDKNDFVDAAVAARTPQGCLSLVNEDYYRKHSVPSFSPPTSSSTTTGRNPSTRGSSNTNTNAGPRSTRAFPRPDLDPTRRQRQETTRPRTASFPAAQTTRPSSEQPNISRPTSSSGRHTPNTTSATYSRGATPMPPPPMSTLVTLPRSSLSALSIGTLKQILFEARVRVPPGVVEKEELVERVWVVIEEEKRKDNEGIDNMEFRTDEDEMEVPDREEEVVEDMVDPEYGTYERTPGDGHGDVRDHTEGGSRGWHQETGSNPPPSRSATPQRFASPSTSPSRSAVKSKPRSNSKSMNVEHSGLCVICQDEEASIAVIDCGHLAMCRECSELVLSSSKECPLCRTRIVTESRLLRIFKT